MKTSRSKLIVILMLLFILSIPTSIAIANSLPPPYRLWLRFVNENEKPVQVTSLQIAGCEDETCQSPEYLIGFGKCTFTECYTGEPKQSDAWKLDCVDNQCLFEVHYPFSEEIPAYLQMLASSNNSSWKTNALLTPDCQYCDTGIKVVLAPSGASISLDEDFDNTSEDSLFHLFLTFLFTVGTEVIVSLLFYTYWKHKSVITWKILGWSVVLANVISYPVAWLTIPAFGQFQTDSMRRLGFIALGISIVITILTLVIQANSERFKKWILIPLIPACAFVTFVLVIFSAFGINEIHPNGLPPAAVIVVAELFAVLFETLYIHHFCKPEMNIKQIFALCLVMNFASWLCGTLIF